MDYASAVSLIMNLVDLERFWGNLQGTSRYNLSRMHILLDRLGNPHLRVPTIHVTGTKGKGSVSAMITSILTEAGYTVGLYTSPHLHSVRERISLNREPISERMFADLVEEVWPAIDAMCSTGEVGRVTTFETLTAMAFLCFAQRGVDIQGVEVGLGGTLDATNVVESPLVSVITSISLDHTNILGDTVQKIAKDKSGIIKKGSHVVIAPQETEVVSVIEQVCKELNVPLIDVSREFSWDTLNCDLDGQLFQYHKSNESGDIWMPLLGDHQIENACCALAVIQDLITQGIVITDDNITRGFQNVRWPGRFEVLNRDPITVADGAHNPYSIERLVDGIEFHFPSKQCILVLGCSRGHSLEGIIKAIARLNPRLAISTKSRHPRAIETEEISKTALEFGLGFESQSSVADGILCAQNAATMDDIILVTGSLFTVAEAREYYYDIQPELYPKLPDPKLYRG